MYVLSGPLGRPRAANAFSLLGLVTALTTGAMIQANAIASVLWDTAGLSPWISGAFTAALAAPVLLGGRKRIAEACQLLVPAMAGLYLLGCLGVLFQNRTLLPEAVSLILRSAFLPRAAGGGFVGSTLLSAARYGVARGLFTNESGMGTAPMTAAAAPRRSVGEAALVSMTAVFWDTVVICAVTGLVLVSSILRDPAAF